MNNLNIIADESKHHIDQKLIRVGVCIVEYEDNSIDTPLHELTKRIQTDEMRYSKTEEKLHFSGLSLTQRSNILEEISKWPITAKVFIHYRFSSDESVASLYAMRHALNHVRTTHKDQKLNIQIENSQEYSQTELEACLTDDEFLTLLPDAFLHTFNNFLDNTNGHDRDGDSARLYSLIREKVRLQYFEGERLIGEYLTRGKRI